MVRTTLKGITIQTGIRSTEHASRVLRISEHTSDRHCNRFWRCRDQGYISATVTVRRGRELISGKILCWIELDRCAGTQCEQIVRPDCCTSGGNASQIDNIAILKLVHRASKGSQIG
jgi:hypothetical protein